MIVVESEMLAILLRLKLSLHLSFSFIPRWTIIATLSFLTLLVFNLIHLILNSDDRDVSKTPRLTPNSRVLKSLLKTTYTTYPKCSCLATWTIIAEFVETMVSIVSLT